MKRNIHDHLHISYLDPARHLCTKIWYEKKNQPDYKTKRKTTINQLQYNNPTA